MNKLSINPKIRAKLDKAPLIKIINREIEERDWVKPARDRVLLLHDGLIYDYGFPPYYGAFFVLNYERYLDGLLGEEQLDRFVTILLDRIEIPYLKAVHPQANIEGLFTALLYERRRNSRNSQLLDTINYFDRLPCWRRASKGRSHYFAVKAFVLRSAPFSIVLGHSPVTVLEQLRQELGKDIDGHCVPPALKRPMLDRYLDHFLIGYPDLWPVIGVNATRFLGEPMLGRLPNDQHCADTSVVNGNAGKPLISRSSSHDDQELAQFILDYLSNIDPMVLDAMHLLRDGSRSRVWLDRCANLEEGLSILSMLCHYGITHPALKRINQVAVRLSEEGQKGLVMKYLNQGSAITEQMTHVIIKAKPELYDWAFEQCRSNAAVLRLLKIRSFTSDQLGKLEPAIKRLLLERDLGV